MANRTIQNSFTGGIISPALIGRADDVGYKTGAFNIENFYVLPQGSLRSRSGFEYVMSLKGMEGVVRLIPFRYASDQTLVLVLSAFKMNILTEGLVQMNEDGTPYEIWTPFSAEVLKELNYSQNADILTFTSPDQPPYEIRRYGGTDWRLLPVDIAPKLSAPTNVSTKAIYAPYLTDAENKDKNKLKPKYVVTALNEDGYESLPSSPVEGAGNYYIDGCSIEVSWGAVEAATRYNVYREVAGVYGYIGHTEELSLKDVGNNPDMNTTPPKYAQPFGTEGGNIKEIKVTDGGTGYTYFKYPNGTFNVNKNWPIDKAITFKWDVTSPYVSASDSDAQNRALNIISNGCSDTPIVFYIYIYTIDKENPKYKIKLDKNIKSSTEKTNLGADLGVNQYKFHHVKEVTIASPFDFSDFRLKFSQLSFRIFWERQGSWYHRHIDDAQEWGPYPTQRFEGYFSYPQFKYSLITPSGNELYNKLFSDTGSGITWDEYLSLYADAQKDIISSIPLEITDSSNGTGRGATAFATAKDGIIDAVTITSAGTAYSSPQIKIADALESYTGQGALFNAVVNPIQNNSEYPSAVTQFDQRRIFAGSYQNPLRIWLTNAGVQDQMIYHIPTMSDDRIQVTAVTSDADRIKHAVALESLILLTGSSELRVYTQNSDSLSPSSIAVRAQSYIGANSTQPVIVNNQVLYVSSRGGHIYSMGYLSTAGGYITSDISIRAPHLFDGFDIKDLALCKAPVQTLFATSTNGRLLACTYYAEQNVVAWFEITSKDALFESCCCVAEGVEDRLYVVANRNGVRSVERLGVVKIPLNSDDYTYLDSYSEGKFKTPSQVVTGLDRFNGQIVGVFADGKQLKNQVVNNGQITLEEKVNHVLVGYPISCRLVTLPLTYQAEAYMQGRVKNISELYIRCSNEGVLKGNNYGQDNMYRCSTVTSGNSDVRQVLCDGVWDYNGQLELIHDDAYPLEINAIIANTTFSQEGAKA